MRSNRLVLVAGVASVLALVSPILGAGERALPRRDVIPAQAGGKTVDQAAMQAVYEKVKTPYKYGIVLPAPPGKKVDCPSVYRHQGRWYMRYITFDGAGYETWLAASSDLLKWEPLGRLLSFRQGTWDANQAAGFVALQDPAWGGSCELENAVGSAGRCIALATSKDLRAGGK